MSVRSKENMQSLISSKSFSGQMLSCIVDSQGQVIISPTDLKPFLQLEDIFGEVIARHTEDAAGYERKNPKFTDQRRTAPSYITFLNINEPSPQIYRSRPNQYILQSFVT